MVDLTGDGGLRELALFAGAGGGILGGHCSDGEPSAPLNVMPTPQPFWHGDKTMDVLHRSPFGQTYAPLTANRGEELLTLFRAAFPARTSALPDAARASTANDPGCGENSREWFAKLDPDSCSWKTPQPSLFAELESCSVIWPLWGTMRGGVCFPLAMPDCLTSARVSGLLPTVTKSWSRRGCGLSNNPDRLRMSPESTALSLQIIRLVGWRWPVSFIEWMQAWPHGWSGLRALETDKFRQWLRSHGAR